MTANCPDGKTFDCVAEMEAFDLLPRSVRDALNHAIGDYSASEILLGWKAKAPGFKNTVNIVRRIKLSDRDAIADPSPTKGDRP